MITSCAGSKEEDQRGCSENQMVSYSRGGAVGDARVGDSSIADPSLLSQTNHSDANPCEEWLLFAYSLSAVKVFSWHRTKTK